MRQRCAPIAQLIHEGGGCCVVAASPRVRTLRTWAHEAAGCVITAESVIAGPRMLMLGPSTLAINETWPDSAIYWQHRLGVVARGRCYDGVRSIGVSRLGGVGSPGNRLVSITAAS